MGTPSHITLRARYVFPVDGAPVEDGTIKIVDGRIVSVERGGRASIDLGNVAVVPGFVNAHTHLELSALPLSPPFDGDWKQTEPQLDWLRRMIAWRRSSDPELMSATVQRNLNEVIHAGTTTIADVTTLGQSWEAAISSPIRGVIFTELLGLKRSRGLETSASAFSWLAKVRKVIPENNARLRAGLSPHAPYSTAGWLFQRAASSHLQLTTHLAEMPEEVELLATREGPLRAFLEEIGAWDEGWHMLGTRPADYVRRGELRQSDWIIAHGNYLEPCDFWQLRPQAAPRGQRVAVAYCPRTHARFGHQPHPYAEMLRRGAIVCLGTDSLATAPSLSLLDEMRYLHRRDPELKGSLLLGMGTIFGAWALRLDTVCGTIEPGKSADFAVIPLPNRDADDPHQLLFDSDHPVIATMIGGEFVTGEWV